MLRKVFALLLALSLPVQAGNAVRAIAAQRAWIAPYNPVFDCDFVAWKCALNGTYIAPEQALSLTRTTSGFAPWGDGHWSSFPSGVMRHTDFGLLVEPGATNLALRSRDLTQSAWTCTNVTAARNATGFDNNANGASTLTATAANGTCLQSITHANSAFTLSFFAQCVNCTGGVSATLDNTTYTSLSSSNCGVWPAQTGTAPGTAKFVRCTLGQTVTNPNIGFKIVSNGSGIIVDEVQLEATGYGTSPITTTTVSAQRNSDGIQATAPIAAWIVSHPWPTTFFINTMLETSGVGTPVMMSLSDSTSNNRCETFLNGTLHLSMVATAAGTQIMNIAGSIVAVGTPFTSATLCNTADYAASYNGGTVSTNTTAGALPAVTTLGIGSRGSNAALPFAGLITRATILSGRYSNTQMQGLTK